MNAVGVTQIMNTFISSRATQMKRRYDEEFGKIDFSC